MKEVIAAQLYNCTFTMKYAQVRKAMFYDTCMVLCITHTTCTDTKNNLFFNKDKMPMDLGEFEEQLVDIFAEYEEVVENFSVNVQKSIELLEKLKARVSECKQV
eukprot:jgi/Antlo1/1526/1817